jgi:hypothetical protein
MAAASGALTSLQKKTSPTAGDALEIELTLNFKDQMGDLGLSVLCACGAMNSMAKSLDSSFVEGENQMADWTAQFLGLLAGAFCPFVMMKFVAQFKLDTGGGTTGKVQRCMKAVGALALVVEFAATPFLNLSDWEMRYHEPVFAESWPTPSLFPEAAKGTCYPAPHQPGTPRPLPSAPPPPLPAQPDPAPELL